MRGSPPPSQAIVILLLIAHLLTGVVSVSHVRTVAAVKGTEGQTILVPICTVAGIEWHSLTAETETEGGPQEPGPPNHGDPCIGIWVSAISPLLIAEAILVPPAGADAALTSLTSIPLSRGTPAGFRPPPRGPPSLS